MDRVLLDLASQPGGPVRRSPFSPLPHGRPIAGVSTASRKLSKDDREHLHGVLGDASEVIAASVVMRPADRAVNNVRTLGRNAPGLITPVELS